MIQMEPPPPPPKPQLPRSHAVAAAVNSPPPQSNKQAANDEDMFSPTSAAALALSTLHHFGANQRPRPPTSGLIGTRLFNTSNTNSNNGPIAPSSYRSSSPSPAAGGRGNNGCHYYPPRPEQQHSYSHYASSNRWPEVQPRGGIIGNPETTPSSSSQQPPPRQPSPWGGVPPSHYASRYAPPPGPDGSTSYHSMENRPPSSLGSTPSTGRRSPPSSQEKYHYAEDRPHSAVPHENLYHHHRHPRGSPPCLLGPSPPMSRSNSFNPPTMTSEKPFARLASTTTLVTPTPKKQKVLMEQQQASNNHNSNNTYSRKKKSLGILAENFLKTYEELPEGSTIVVDEAAVQLGVERRRIYDVVNILESICLVSKKHKNTYSWMGMGHLDAVFGRLQAQAIVEYPDDAKMLLGMTSQSTTTITNTCTLPPVPLKPPRRQSSTSTNARENKSLAKMSQEFLQVFLVGHEILSLPEASDKIQGATSVEELIAMGMKKDEESNTGTSTTESSIGGGDPKELKAAAARGLKTKIRRLYDIANVFLSVGLLKKVESCGSMSGDANNSRRPNFSWSYRLSAKALYELHRPAADAKKTIQGEEIKTSSEQQEAAAGGGSSDTDTETEASSSTLPPEQ